MNNKVHSLIVLLTLDILFLTELIKGISLTKKHDSQIQQTKGATFGEDCDRHTDCNDYSDLFCLQNKCQCLKDWVNDIHHKWYSNLSKCVEFDYCKNDYDCKDYGHRICDLEKGILMLLF